MDSLVLGTTAYTDAVDASTVFTGMTAGTYNLVFANGNVSIASAAIPEPTTATLSLLALAGLCARRRRH